MTPTLGPLRDRDAGEVYLHADEDDGEYLVYFPEGGRVALDVGHADDRATVEWLAVGTADWEDGGDGRTDQVVLDA